MKGVSILICTYNGASKLPATLRHLLLLDTSMFEEVQLIVVNNASTDGTAAVVDDFRVRLSEKFRFEMLDEPNAGKLNALRTGVLRCEHEFTLLCDDDNWLSSDYLRVAATTILQNPRIGALGGRAELPKAELGLPSWFPHYQHVFALGEQTDKAGEVKDPHQNLWGAGTFYRTRPYQRLFESGYEFHLSARRGPILFGGDDIEIGLILRILGSSIYYDPKLLFFHDLDLKRVTQDFMMRRFFGFGRSRLIIRAYLHVMAGNPMPRTRLPYWFDRYLHLRKELKRLLSLIDSAQDPERVFDLRLQIEAQKGELEHLWDLKWDYHKIFGQVERLIAQKHLYHD